ncbi:MAG: lysine--tRNA ligase [Candidatus Microgenomates bacterium]
MHWADKIAQEIIDSGKYQPYWTDDMYTPSGFAHIGSIRGPLIHDLIYKYLVGREKKTISTYIFNDFDPIDGLPQNLQKDFEKYMGIPLRIAPSPVKGYRSFADYFRSDFEKVLRSIGIEAKFVSSWDMYHQGKFDEVIKTALDNGDKIQEIYHKVSGSEKRQQGWLPFQVICEKCGRLGTTKVYAWDGEEVSYKCEPDLVTWARGCGYEGKTSPFGGKGKLPWKVDWPAHWKVMGVTIEGSGKEHGTAGGSRDIAKALCEEVFNYPNPFNIVYEYFLIGGKKMSSSKGLGLRAHDLLKIVPPELGRFLFIRTNYKEQIEFNPFGTLAIPDLFDEYDRAWQAYNSGSNTDLSRVFELSQIKDVPTRKDNLVLPRFRDVANMLVQGKKAFPGKFEQRVLEERIKYAKMWKIQSRHFGNLCAEGHLQ